MWHRFWSSASPSDCLSCQASLRQSGPRAPDLKPTSQGYSRANDLEWDPRKNPILLYALARKPHFLARAEAPGLTLLARKSRFHPLMYFHTFGYQTVWSDTVIYLWQKNESGLREYNRWILQSQHSNLQKRPAGVLNVRHVAWFLNLRFLQSVYLKAFRAFLYQIKPLKTTYSFCYIRENLVFFLKQFFECSRLIH